MSTFTLVAILVAVAVAVAFIIIRSGTPAPTVSSMLRRSDTAGEGR